MRTRSTPKNPERSSALARLAAWLRRPVRRTAATLGAVSLLAAGLAVVGVAAPASAHTGDLLAKAVCDTETGLYEVTYTLELTQVDKSLTGATKWRIGGASFDGTPTSAAGLDRGPITSKGNVTLTLGTSTLPGTTKGSGPWVYAYTTWSDKYGKGSDGRVENLKGDCVKKQTEIKVEGAPTFDDTCGPDNEQLVVPEDTTKIDWSSSESKGVITVTATAKPGYVFKAGQTTKWTFTIDDSPCSTTPNGTPKVSDVCGPDNEIVTLPKDTDSVSWSSTKSGHVVTVTATAKPGYVFPKHTTTTWTFTVDDGPCVVDVVGAPSFRDTCGPDNEQLTVPTDTASIDWSSSESAGVVTVTATAKPGYVFKPHSKTSWTFTIDDSPCEIEVVGAPGFSDTCGPDNEKLTVPADTDEIDWSSSETGGVVTVTATAKAGFAFPKDAKTTWTYSIDDSPCVVDLVGAPSFADTCGPDNEDLTVPVDTDTVDWSSSEAEGVVTVTATPKPGFAFPEGTTTTWSYALLDADCVPASLLGSLATGVCEADVPWITYSIALSDPDAQSTSHEAFLVMTDGTNTERIDLGEIDPQTGLLQGRVLWPGAAVDAQGKAAGWPGWVLEADGTWSETTGNFAWTRTLKTATIEVNPELAVELSYPPATPNCATGPRTGGGLGGALASTGFSGGPFVVVAGIILVLGAALVVFAIVRRRKRA